MLFLIVLANKVIQPKLNFLNFLKYITDKKIIKNIEILTLSNYPLGIKYLEMSQCQSDLLISINIRNDHFSINIAVSLIHFKI